MKLVFTKESNNDIKVQIQTGTVLTDFSYIEMVKQLIENKKIDDVYSDSFEEDEKAKIIKMLDEISKIFTEEEGSNSNSENEIN
ncbi:hypothetical protein LF887_14375 [Chryseobacterium sp. MEBOG06]|uniref:hypothetical protein n=1 Tax=Chryseobacterium sp. MEBOG06 TaxID=2879938 RepID=UPI001F2F5493|nr:hypothetical protein [Chryseobacterium sp. MEBOG06]UKB82192.1 hypothetical protein LF887_14375 [Chryseobacterium sp. MEBOG06]